MAYGGYSIKKTLFPLFQRPHEHLLAASSLYSWWHEKAVSSAVHYLVLLTALTVKVALIVSVLSPAPLLAASTTFTSTADFSSFTHSSTEAASNSLRLTASTSSEGVTTKSATLPSARFAASVVRNPTTGKIYIFGGANGTEYGGSVFNAILEYNPATDSLTTKSATLPTARSHTAAVWDSNNSKAYIFGGKEATDNTNQVLEYNPATDSLTTKSATFPAPDLWEPDSSAIAFNPDNGKIYIFGGYSYAGDQDVDDIWEYTPGTDTMTVKSAVLPVGMNGASAVWSTTQQKIYIFGGTSSLVGDQNTILEYSVGGDSITTKSATMPTAGGGTSAVWDSTTNRAYIFADATSAIREYNPATDSISTKSVSLPSSRTYSLAAWDGGIKTYIFGGNNSGSYLSSIVQYDSGGTTYASSGSAARVVTPTSGTDQNWESASVNKTDNGQTATIQYTTNTNCLNDLTTDITSLGNSESICVKVSLSTTNTAVTPSVEDISLTYSEVPAPTPTPTPTPEPTPTPTPEPDPTPTPTPAPAATPTPTAAQQATTSTPTPSPTASPSATALDVASILACATTSDLVLSATQAESCSQSIASQHLPSPSPASAKAAIAEGLSSISENISTISQSIGDDLGSIGQSIGTIVSAPMVLGASTTVTVLTGAAVVAQLTPVLAQTLVKFAQTVSNLPNFYRNFWFNLISIAGRSKRRRRWGIVKDSQTGRPIDNVLVSLLAVKAGKDNLFIEKNITDPEGRFGFLAALGAYKIMAQKNGYVFPSTLFGQSYHGQSFELDQKQTLTMEIYLDPLIDRSSLSYVIRKLLTLIDWLRLPLLIVGTLLASYTYVRYPIIVNLVFLLIYGGLWLVELVNRNTSRNTIQLVDERGQILPFTMMHFVNKTSGLVAQNKVTDKAGEAYVLLPKGTYIVRVPGPRNPKGSEQTIDLPQGVAPRRMQVKVLY